MPGVVAPVTVVGVLPAVGAERAKQSADRVNDEWRWFSSERHKHIFRVDWFLGLVIVSGSPGKRVCVHVYVNFITTTTQLNKNNRRSKVSDNTKRINNTTKPKIRLDVVNKFRSTDDEYKLNIYIYHKVLCGSILMLWMGGGDG